MPIVADQYDLLMGVDTHAATHSLSLASVMGPRGCQEDGTTCGYE